MRPSNQKNKPHMIRIALLLALFSLSFTGHAQAYRCVENGKTIFLDRPCSPPQIKNKKQPEKEKAEKTAAQIQAEFEAEQADIKEGERLQAMIEASRANEAAKKKKALEDAQLACQAEKSKPAIVRNSSWDGSVAQVMAYLNLTLRDPSSFEAITWGKVMRTCDGYSVFLKYRARNGFGGMAVASQIFTLDKSGKVVSVDR